MAAPPLPHEGTFPKLTDEQRARIAVFARERRFADGELLWDQGEDGRPLYVVLEGKITILSGADVFVTAHEPGQFSGDVDMLAGRPAVVRGRATGETRVLELPASRLRVLVQTDPELSEIFLKAFIYRRLLLQTEHAESIVLIGSRHSPGTLLLEDFLTRNGQPFTYLDVERDPDAQRTLDALNVGVDDVPVLICRGTRVLRRPTIEEVGDCLGLNRLDTATVHDVAVVGAGPGGLAAAVYAASEGLDVVVLEASAPGGQAGSSSKIENYLGFPLGISGEELANRALVQAQKFGASIAVAREALRLACERHPYEIEVADGPSVKARTVILATGVRYRKPDLPNLARFEGVGVYYGATRFEASLCEGREVIVVGGGNSAGQAAVFLSRRVRHLHMLVRGEGLAATMSRYLIRRIEETPNITLRTRTRIEALEGDGALERVTWRDGSGALTTVDVEHVFLMTGANPNTGWLKDCVALDERGFVKTGPGLVPEDLDRSRWPARAPLLFETSLPGVFAIGDVRASSVKRVAAAVGEGSVCIQLAHQVLAE
jgi:thioredoxin reductase (NADPH)